MAFLTLTQKDTNMSFTLNTDSVICVEDSSEGTRIIFNNAHIYITEEDYLTVIGQFKSA
jgi:hypothetical protein